MKHVIVVAGARPNFIKIAPLVSEFNRYKRYFKSLIVHTGQHYDFEMSEVFFRNLKIPKPDIHLNVGSASHAVQTAKIMVAFEKVVLKEKPDLVVVVGDVNSTLACSLAASKLNVKVAHVEAGLRSYNKYMPEEINRVLTDHSSSILLCPTETAVKNLQKEGFSNLIHNGKLIDNNPNFTCLHPMFYISHFTSNVLLPLVINVGDVMYDVFLYAVKIAEKQSDILNHLNLTTQNYYLLTLHRAENTDNKKRFEEIIDFVNNVSAGKKLIFPMHPRTKKVYKSTDRKFSGNINIIDPVGYFDILILLKHSALLMTDSGGMQKEAYWLKVPCITLRDETEWVETIQSGWNVLYKNYDGLHRPTDKDGTYYGDGKAAERIVNVIYKL